MRNTAPKAATFLRSAACAATLFCAVAVSAFADDDLASKAINSPTQWGFWGAATSETVTDATVAGGSAKRLVIATMPGKPWDVGAYTMITKPVKKGDVLLLALWVRAEKPPEGNDFIAISGRIFEASTPSIGITEQADFLVGKQWKLFYTSGTADKDYPVGTLSCGLLLGTGAQTIDFGPAFVADYGQGYDLSKLPQN